MYVYTTSCYPFTYQWPLGSVVLNQLIQNGVNFVPGPLVISENLPGLWEWRGWERGGEGCENMTYVDRF